MASQLDSELLSRFVNVQVIGGGGNSVVLQAHDTSVDTNVALKKISFTNRESSVRALREIRALRKLSHENITKIYDLIARDCPNEDHESKEVLQQIYLVQELLDTDLHHLIRANLLTSAHSTCFTYQILCALKYMHSANIVHRDLKPSNILIDCGQLTAKICDFGLSRVVDSNYSHAVSCAILLVCLQCLHMKVQACFMWVKLFFAMKWDDC